MLVLRQELVAHGITIRMLRMNAHDVDGLIPADLAQPVDVLGIGFKHRVLARARRQFLRRLPTLIAHIERQERLQDLALVARGGLGLAPLGQIVNRQHRHAGIPFSFNIKVKR
jgi:broad specificity phosphatase PhoE